MWENVEIVSLAGAKQHLRITTTTQDADINTKLVQAHDIVLNYVKRISDTDWTDTMLAWTTDTAPPQIQAALLRMLTNLWEHRGDDDYGVRTSGHFLPADVMQLLNEYHEFVIA